MRYYLHYNESGEITGNGLTPDGTIPKNSVECTKEQSQNFQNFVAYNGQLVSAPLSQLLTQAQSAQSATLRAACANAITGGFVSLALGTPHTYPSTLTDQHNLSVSVVASLLPNLPIDWTTPFWVMENNSTGAWTFAPHTVAQIQQAGVDGRAWVTAQQVQLQSLELQVMAAKTVSAVQATVWPGTSNIGGATPRATRAKSIRG